MFTLNKESNYSKIIDGLNGNRENLSRQKETVIGRAYRLGVIDSAIQLIEKTANYQFAMNFNFFLRRNFIGVEKSILYDVIFNNPAYLISSINHEIRQATFKKTKLNVAPCVGLLEIADDSKELGTFVMTDLKDYVKPEKKVMDSSQLKVVLTMIIFNCLSGILNNNEIKLIKSYTNTIDITKRYEIEKYRVVDVSYKKAYELIDSQSLNAVPLDECVENASKLLCKSMRGRFSYTEFKGKIELNDEKTY
ncbi:MAG: hypothetical protein WCK31_04390, partial [bacterium]